MENPCFEFRERHMGCHADCAVYLTFWRTNKDRNERKLIDKSPVDYMQQYFRTKGKIRGRGVTVKGPQSLMMKIKGGK